MLNINKQDVVVSAYFCFVQVDPIIAWFNCRKYLCRLFNVEKTHPHLAQVPVVIVRLILVGQFSAQDDAVLPTLKTFKKKKTHNFFFYPHSHCQGASCLTSCSAVGAAKMHAPHWVAPVSRQYQESNITSSCRYMQHPAILLIKWKASLPCRLLIPAQQHWQMA